jgi:hypothetical protein
MLLDVLFVDADNASPLFSLDSIRGLTGAKATLDAFAHPLSTSESGEIKDAIENFRSRQAHIMTRSPRALSGRQRQGFTSAPNG